MWKCVFAANSALLHTVRNIVPLFLQGAPHEGCGVLCASRSALGESSRYSAGPQNQEGPSRAGSDHWRCSLTTARPTQQKVNIFPHRQKYRLGDLLLLFFFILIDIFQILRDQHFQSSALQSPAKALISFPHICFICLKRRRNVHLTLGVVANQPEQTISALFDIIKWLFPELNPPKKWSEGFLYCPPALSSWRWCARGGSASAANQRLSLCGPASGRRNWMLSASRPL